MAGTSSNIAIIGGGLAGLTLSIGLTRCGIKHKIYEAASAFAEIGAGIAMGPNAVSALTLIDRRIRDCYDRCATYNESKDLQDTWVSALLSIIICSGFAVPSKNLWDQTASRSQVKSNEITVDF